jgi:hypothetical protein
MKYINGDQTSKRVIHGLFDRSFIMPKPIAVDNRQYCLLKGMFINSMSYLIYAEKAF